MAMSPDSLLVAIPALPLVGVLFLALAGRRLGRWSGWIATALVGGSFAAAAFAGLQFLTDSGPSDASDADGQRDTDQSSRAPVVRTLWRWIRAGDDLVEVTIALDDLAQLTEIPEESVGTAWYRADAPGLDDVLGRMWDPEAVVGVRPMGSAPVPAGRVLTDLDVPPTDAGLIVADPRRIRAMSVDLALQLDDLSLIMALVVSGVGFLVHLYSLGRMASDTAPPQFFLYLSLLVFSMLVLVLAGDFLVLAAGWELIGLCSYLLIGLWFSDKAGYDARRQVLAFRTVGDVGLILGLILIWTAFGSLAYAEVIPNSDDVLAAGSTTAAAITLLLLLGAFGKSAQVPLQIWSADALGATPVSVVTVSAAMVAAGVYVIARAWPLCERTSAAMAPVTAFGAAAVLIGGLAVAYFHFGRKRPIRRAP